MGCPHTVNIPAESGVTQSEKPSRLYDLIQFCSCQDNIFGVINKNKSNQTNPSVALRQRKTLIHDLIDRAHLSIQSRKLLALS